jgi:hypothetical protein
MKEFELPLCYYLVAADKLTCMFIYYDNINAKPEPNFS